MTTSKQRFFSSMEIVEEYLTFFRSRNHMELAGSTLVGDDNSTSFIIAGMQPLVPYLTGLVVPPAPRLVSLQRCLRTDDVSDVGINVQKCSGFHMLGNWSLGNYGKHEAIEMALELLLNVFSLDKEKLWITVFRGDTEMGLPPDEEAIEEWLRFGIPQERIVPLGEDNFWTMGPGPGPCGPNSEIFVDRGIELGCGLPTCRPGCSCDRFLEIWNLVFMDYERHPDGTLTKLPQRNIDTGMGLERIAVIVQGVESCFSIDVYGPVLQKLEEFAPGGIVGDPLKERLARRVIVDHTRAVLLAGVEGVEPGRDGRNSVVRKLIRRAARQGRVLGINKPFLSQLLLPLVEGHGNLLSEQELRRAPLLIDMLLKEEVMFERALTVGLKHLADLEADEDSIVSGVHLFRLHAEKGFPADLAAEILSERGWRIDWSSYEAAVEEHRRVSRISAEKRFSR